MRIYGFPVVEHRAPSLTPCLFPSKSPSAPLRSAAERLPHLLRFSSASEVRGLAGLNTEQRAYHCLAGCKIPVNIGGWGWVTDCFTQDWLAPVGKKIVKFSFGKINISQDLKGILMTFKTLLSGFQGVLWVYLIRGEGSRSQLTHSAAPICLEKRYSQQHAFDQNVTLVSSRILVRSRDEHGGFVYSQKRNLLCLRELA